MSTASRRPARGGLAHDDSVLLANGDYLGTLAAARDLGRAGVRVVLADPSPQTITGRSRYVDRLEPSPGLDRPGEWIDWLVAFGEREPGHVLLPTSDDMCWLVDKHRARLEGSFRLYQPASGGIWQLLDKRSLHGLCREVGLDAPDQWTADQALARAATLPYPVIVKPCTQAGLRVNPKGLLAGDEATLRGALARFRDRHGYRDEMLAHDPTVVDLMVQAFHPEAEQNIYSLAGFYAPETGTYGVRASQKVLQHPLRIGTGLCFEGRAVRPALAAGLRALFDKVGYRGAFEAEFVQLQGSDRFLLIDLNPRFYGQMAFEIARGLPIPRLCYLAARGRWDDVRRLGRMDRVLTHVPDRICNAWLVRLYATTHLIGGNFSLHEWRYWVDWAKADGATDPVHADDDPSPARHLRRQVGHDLVRRPRSTLKRFFVR